MPYQEESVNVLGTKLTLCGERPMTGFFRDGVGKDLAVMKFEASY